MSSAIWESGSPSVFIVFVFHLDLELMPQEIKSSVLYHCYSPKNGFPFMALDNPVVCEMFLFQLAKVKPSVKMLYVHFLVRMVSFSLIIL
jgi:hypothetical protein